MSTPSTYVYDNDHPAATDHHACLAAMLDLQTTDLLRRLRLWGAGCLEVGAGAGSIAAWLAEEVGSDGHVLATDLDPMPMPEHPRLLAMRHDIVNEPVPAGPWNIIHTRLLLQHLPQRRKVLAKLAGALAPGGVLVVEDWDMTWTRGRVLAAPDRADVALFERVQNTIWDVMEQAGVDRSWAPRALRAMLQDGLVKVSAQFHTQSWAGGSAGARLLAGTTVQLGDKLRARGLTDDDLHRMRELMANPDVVFRMPPMVSSMGYRPSAAGPGAPS